MLFWLLFALMTGAAVLAVLWPLSRAGANVVDEREADLAVYRDQLAEIDRDRARGLLDEREAEAARIEVSRRILAAGGKQDAAPAQPGTQSRRRAAAVVALAGIPAIAMGLYLAVGSPGLPDAPLAARLAASVEERDFAILVQQMETHLARNPDDGKGWELLAPVYLSMGRAGDAVKARARALQLLGATSERQSALGEAMVLADKGVVSEQARAAFERAVEQDPSNLTALFYLGLAAEQDGRMAEAVSIWQDLSAKAAPDDPRRIAAERGIARHAAHMKGQDKE